MSTIIIHRNEVLQIKAVCEVLVNMQLDVDVSVSVTLSH